MAYEKGRLTGYPDCGLVPFHLYCYLSTEESFSQSLLHCPPPLSIVQSLPDERVARIEFAPAGVSDAELTMLIEEKSYRRIFAVVSAGQQPMAVDAKGRPERRYHQESCLILGGKG